MLGWIINTVNVTLSHHPGLIEDPTHLLDIQPTQQRMSHKKLEWLIGKLQSIHLTIPGAIGHFYHIYMAQTKSNSNTAYLSNDFHLNIIHLKTLCARMKTCPTNFVEIVQRLLADLGYANASWLGDGGVWLDPNYGGTNFVCHYEWPNDIWDNLISFDNITVGITNSDLELVALILKEATLLDVCKGSVWCTHFTGSNNIPTGAWTFKEATTIKHVVADLLHICPITNTNMTPIPAVIYHPAPLNTMANNVSCRFDLPNPQFLSLFPRKYHPK